jgi:stringent starvation protein B
MPETPIGIPPKRDVTRALLLRGSVFVHLDPRVDGVQVPGSFRQQSQLVLQVGLDLPVPIPDLRIDEEGVHATLSFARSPFTCFVPWEAVFAIADSEGKGMVFADSLPEEIAREISSQPPEEVAPPKRKKTPAARLVPSAPTEASSLAARARTKAKPVAAAAAKKSTSSASKDEKSSAGTSRSPVKKVPVPTSGALRPQAKPKRELPPYLRVVK